MRWGAIFTPRSKQIASADLAESADRAREIVDAGVFVLRVETVAAVLPRGRIVAFESRGKMWYNLVSQCPYTFFKLNLKD
jgi:hypothetical protein